VQALPGFLWRNIHREGSNAAGRNQKRKSKFDHEGREEHEVYSQKYPNPFVSFFENTGRRDLDQFKAEPLDCVIPAWSAGIQIDMDVSPDASLQTWMPAIHAGMTKICIFMFCGRA
jgi:hypothetical protein